MTERALMFVAVALFAVNCGASQRDECVELATGERVMVEDEREVYRSTGDPGTCMPRPLPVLAGGASGCDLTERLPDDAGISCSDLPGRVSEPYGTEAGGTLCAFEPLIPGDSEPTDPGWYYDDFSEQTRAECGSADEIGQRFAFAGGVAPYPGATLQLRCLVVAGMCD